jgi:hypothetical protein
MNCDRRVFLKTAMAVSALSVMPRAQAAHRFTDFTLSPRPKQAGLVLGAFFYPPAQVVLDGKCEDSWNKNEWFTWPGNQFEPEIQQKKFQSHLRTITARMDLNLEMSSDPVYSDAGIQAFIATIQERKPEALLLFNFWNSFSTKIIPILDAFTGPVILYHPVGSNHQLPPERFRTGKRMQYIHAIEDWEALNRGLTAINAKVRMKQSRLLRVSGKLTAEADENEAFFEMPIHGIPAEHFNQLFDETQLDHEMQQLLSMVRQKARHTTDLSDQAFEDAVRAHMTVNQLIEKHDADAITIECLFLKHRKPCLSFAMNNGALVPCGCENDLNASLTLMLGANLFGRGGFQHNPEFDLEENQYLGSHCTCTPLLQGPASKAAVYDLRPFFHQMPKSVAFDVQWPKHERVTLCKYHGDEKRIYAWAGESVESPTCPPVCGCATRVLVKFDNTPDVCQVYPGPHPVLYCGDFAKQLETFAKLYDIEIHTNV